MRKPCFLPRPTLPRLSTALVRPVLFPCPSGLADAAPEELHFRIHRESPEEEFQLGGGGVRRRETVAGTVPGTGVCATERAVRGEWR